MVMLPMGMLGRISILNILLETDQVALVKLPLPTAYCTLVALLRVLDENSKGKEMAT